MPVPPLPPSRKTVFHSRRTTGKLRVFICDDDLEFADELSGALAAAGYEARTLRDGRTPLEIFQLYRPQIVLLDIFMPPPDGFEVMNHIGQDSGARGLSLVLMSGAEDGLLEIAARFCRARGVAPAAVLGKPVRLDDILRVCREHSAPAEEAS